MIPFTGTIRAVVYTALILGPAAYMKGCSDEALRFESFKGGVEAIGKQAELNTHARIEQDKRIALEVMNENSAAFRILADINTRLHNARASSSIVPNSNNSTQAAGGTVCYSQTNLNRTMGESLQRLRDATHRILQQGDEALIDRASWSDLIQQAGEPL